MESLKAAMLYQWHGAAVWVWLVTLVALPIFNELVQRNKKMTAQSILQGIGNAIKASPLYMVPLIKQLANVMATPVQPAIEDHTPVTPMNPEVSDR